MNNKSTAITMNRLSVKTQTMAAAAAIIAAVALPQFFHVMGALSGLGTGLGEAFLPMHLPIILAGLLAGPYAGAAAGLALLILLIVFLVKTAVKWRRKDAAALKQAEQEDRE